MIGPKRQWTNQDTEIIMGELLRIGVIVAAIVVFVGGILYLIQSGTAIAHYGVFRGEPPDLRSVHGIINDVLSLNPKGLIQFGLLLLIATPVARVAFSVYAFSRQRDYTYIIVTIIVLAFLVFSLAGGGL